MTFIFFFLRIMFHNILSTPTPLRHISRRCKTTIIINNRALCWLSWFLNKKMYFCVNFDFQDGVFNRVWHTKNGRKWEKIEIRWKKSKKASWLKNDLMMSLLPRATFGDYIWDVLSELKRFFWWTWFWDTVKMNRNGESTL